MRLLRGVPIRVMDQVAGMTDRETDGLSSRPLTVGLNAVIVAVTQETPRILTVSDLGAGSVCEEDAFPALPYGLLDPEGDRTLELGLRRWVSEQTGMSLGYVEQLYTFGDRGRDPGMASEGARHLSIAYLALVRESLPAGSSAHWRDWYHFFPWEDWRSGRPGVLDAGLLPALERWTRSASTEARQARRRERVDMVFGCHGAPWNRERVLDRYELLFEAGLVRESTSGTHSPAPEAFGLAMALDHRRILATALDRLRGKLKYRPVVFELCPETFTLLQLQRIVEALAGVRLHKQNFRRLVENAGLVEGTGQRHYQNRGRPAELFRFRREVLWERPAPGVGLPG